MQRFNDHEFLSDKTTFDKLSRMQHHSAPTRLLDITEDLMSAVFFSIDEIDTKSNDKGNSKNGKDTKNPRIYVFEIKEKSVKYYDSDAVSVVSNLAKYTTPEKPNNILRFLISNTIK